MPHSIKLNEISLSENKKSIKFMPIIKSYGRNSNREHFANPPRRNLNY